jgi:sporulation protein YlmC with PRC-barrel domain
MYSNNVEKHAVTTYNNSVNISMEDIIMRKNIDSLLGFAILATDGELGKVRDFYFDDENWTLRYLVVQTGSWLLGRKVLLSFASVKKINCEEGTFSVDLTCEQVRHSPDIDTEKPVYRQHEEELHEHYMIPAYWMSSPGGIWGVTNYPYPEPTMPPQEDYEEDEYKSKEVDSKQEKDEKKQHLRSTHEVTNYLVHATDGEIGHVKDFLIDMGNGIITDLVIDTRNLLSGRKVLLSTNRIKRIEWEDTEVYVDVTRGFIIDSPEFDADKDL